MTALLALTVRQARILRIDLSTGAVETLAERVGPVPDGITVESGLICWTTMGRAEVHGPTEAERFYTNVDGGLHAIDVDGTGRRDVVPDGSFTTGKQLAGDGHGTLYWSDREGCAVWRVDLDGTGQTALVVRERDDSWTNECVGVAVDSHSLYWTQKGPAKGGVGRIFRAPLGIPADAAARDDIELLWDGLPEPIDLHLHDGWLYWTDRGAEPDGNSLNRARVPAPGSRGEAPEILARGFHEAIGLVIVDDVAYVSDLAGDIRAVPLDGGPQRTLVALGEPITGLAAL